MRVSLPQIETFYWIARLGSFHAAARHLNITQPTVSVRIRELEAELGMRLFVRTQTRARLTMEGVAVLPQAEGIMTMATKMRRESPPAGGLRGLLRLGVVETVARLALPQLLAYLSDQHAALRVELTVDLGVTLSRRLNDRELDVVIATDPKPADHVAAERLGQIELSWIAGAEHRLAGRSIRPQDLRNERIFTHQKGSTTHDLVDAWFRTARVRPAQIDFCNSVSTITELVEAGLGVALGTPALCRSELERGVIVILKAVPVVASRPMYFCCLREIRSAEIDELAHQARSLLRRSGALLARA